MSCHLQKLLPWHTVECGNLGPSCYKLCRMGFVVILQPVGSAVVITVRHICVYLHAIHMHEQLQDFLNSSADGLMNRRGKKIHSSLLDAAAEGIESKPLFAYAHDYSWIRS